MFFPRRNARRGSIVTLVAISLTVILAFLAISVDGGGLLEKRRHAQATADAAAMAAAEALFRSYPSNWGKDVDGDAARAAHEIASINGFDNDGTTSVVTVRTAPDTYSGGPNAGMPLPNGYAEVSVQYNQKRYFSAIMGTGSLPVRARAVARGNWEPSDVAIHVLDLHEPASLKSTGESYVTVHGASVIINSDSPEAATSTGGVISAPTINIAGGVSVSGGKGGFVGDVNFGVPPEPDPLRHIPEPESMDYSLQSHKQMKVSKGSLTIQPGKYSGGISVSGQGSLIMEPGIYYIEGGGFSFSGQGDLDAQGVMIFNAPKLSSDVVSISGTGTIVMSPPTASLYKGLTLFQARYSPNKVAVSGGGYMYITGTFYAANGTLEVGGGGDSRVGSQYISRFLNIVGNGGLLIDYTRAEAIPRRVLHLVE